MMGWSGPGPWWPLMIVMPLVMLAGFAFLAWMVDGMPGFGPRSARRRHRDVQPPADRPGGGSREDPLAVVRERYARGEIGHDELDRYLDRLLRTDPAVFQHPPGAPREETDRR